MVEEKRANHEGRVPGARVQRDSGAKMGPEGSDRAPSADNAEKDRHEDDLLTRDDSLISEKDALLSLQSQNADLLDAARSVEIVKEKLRWLQNTGLGVGTLNMFNADVSVGRDFSTGGAGARRTGPRGDTEPVPVSLAHISDYTDAYVSPFGFKEALRILEQRHLLVLSAPVGTGRDAAALALLTRVLPQHQEPSEPALFDLNGSAVFNDNSWEVPAEHRGYVVAGETPAGMRSSSSRTSTSVEQLDDNWLTRVSTLLAEAKSFLVVITGPLSGPLSEATRCNDFVVDFLSMPDPVEVVKSRFLASGVHLEPAELDRRLNEAGATDMLTERPRPRFAVKVAMAVMGALKADEDIAVALEKLRDHGEQVREWFGHHDQLDQIAFAVATAVLEGSSFLTVSDAAIELHLKLLSVSKPPPLLRFRHTLATDQPWIELTPDRQEMGVSTVVEAVQFRSPRLQPAILAYAWNEFDGMRPALLAWLGELVGHPDVEVRARAATAAGMLAASDFQHALHRYLLPWANNVPTLRQSAALALNIVGAVPAHRARVWALLRQWAADARPESRSRLPATAAMAAGGPLAIDEPSRALSVLRTLLTDGDWSLLQPVALSILHLVENGSADAVVGALMEWTEPNSNSESLVVKALAAYVVAVRQVAADGALDDWADRKIQEVQKPHWPELLVEAHRFRDELPELWGRALDSPPVRPLALEALREWLRVVDGDWAAFPVVLDILAGVTDRDIRDLERLEYHLDRWARDEDDPSVAADRILAALTDTSLD